MLQKLDNFLLINYPVLWRTRLHILLLSAIPATIILFIAGFNFPISADNLAIDPIEPIELGYDTYYLYTLAACSACLAFWAASLYRSGYRFNKVTHTIQTLLFYAVGLVVIIGFTSAAYRMGTIVKTAYCWMDEKDLNQFATEKKYKYGFVLLREDSTFIRPDTTFFTKRDSIFNEIRAIEDTLLAHRYDDNNSFWFNISYGSRMEDESFKNYSIAVYSKFPANLLFQRNLYYRYYRSDLTYHIKTLEGAARNDLAYIAFLLYRMKPDRKAILSYQSYRSYLAYREDISSKKQKLKYKSDETYDNIQASLLSQTDSLGRKTYYSRTPVFYPSVRPFDKAYFQWRHPEVASCDPDFIKKYKLTPQTDSVRFFQDTLFVKRPTHPYQAENAVRSVLHARQFLEKSIFWRHFRLILIYLPILVCLLFVYPFVSVRQLMVVITFIVGASVLLTFFDINTWANKTPKRAELVNELTFLSSLGLGVGYLFWTLITEKQGKLIPVAYASIFSGLVIVILGSLNLNMLTIIKIDFPSNGTFIKANILALASCFLINYVKSLPKGR